MLEWLCVCVFSKNNHYIIYVHKIIMIELLLCVIVNTLNNHDINAVYSNIKGCKLFFPNRTDLAASI